MKFVGRLVVVAALTVTGLVGGACSRDQSRSVVVPSFEVPGSPSPVSPRQRPLSMVIGTWTGTETASVGESGTLSVTFTQDPSPDTTLAANITWTSAQTSLVYSGTLTGTLDAMVLTATNNPGGTMCGYTASGSINDAGTEITGSYTGTGPTPCPSKAGTFFLSGQSETPPPPPANQGCTPGYWKQDQHFDSWQGYTQSADFDATFGVDFFSPDITLLQALGLGGGGMNALARHGVAGLLDAASSGVNYAYTVAQVIDIVQGDGAYAGHTIEARKDLLAAANEGVGGCPLD